MDGVRYSEVDPADPRILRLMEAQQLELGDIYRLIDPEHRDPETFDPSMLKEPRCAVVAAFVGDDVVACGAIRPMGQHCAEVKRMYTSPSLRGRGLAGHIVSNLVSRARFLDFSRLHLTTSVNQPQAISVYNRAGFDKAPPYGPYVTDKYAVCFSLTLKPESHGELSRSDCPACAE